MCGGLTRRVRVIRSSTGSSPHLPMPRCVARSVVGVRCESSVSSSRSRRGSPGESGAASTLRNDTPWHAGALSPRRRCCRPTGRTLAMPSIAADAIPAGPHTPSTNAIAAAEGVQRPGTDASHSLTRAYTRRFDEQPSTVDHAAHLARLRHESSSSAWGLSAGDIPVAEPRW